MTNLIDGLQRVQEALENAKQIARVENWPENGKIIDQALALLPALIEQAKNDGWLPIESAPKDGTEILCIDCDGKIDVVKYYYFYGGWIQSNCQNTEYSPMAENPTHWMPLPQPPKEG